jgi:hypothetical protein
MSGYAESIQEPRNDVPCRYISTPPLTKWTFEDKQIRQWAESHLEGRVLNACCGKSILEHDGEVVRNDLDETLDADLHVDVAELPIHLEPASFDTIVFDPPWTVYQSNLVYEGRHVHRSETDIDLQELPFHVDVRGKNIVGHARLAKEGFDYLLRGGGKVLQLTAHGTCMPSRLGYERLERVVFDPYGEAKAVIGSVDRRNQSKLGFTEVADVGGDD